MDKIRRGKRKEVHARLDFGENPRKSQRVREGSQNSSAETLPARYHNPSERPKMWDHLKYNDEDVLDRLGHRRQSAFDRLSNTYSPSTTKSGPNEGNSRDRSHSRGRSRRRGSSSRDRLRNRIRPRGIEESYGNNRSSYRAGDRHGYHARNMDRSRSMKRERESESPLSRVSESGTSDGGRWKTRAKRRKPADEEDLSVPWTCEDVDPFTPRIWNFKSSRKTRMPNNVKTYNENEDPEDHLKIFQAATQVERWAMPTWCHMFNYTLIGAERVWFDELSPESIYGYKGLKAAFLAYFMQQKKVWFDELPPKSIDGYKGLKAAFLVYFMQQKKYVKDPVEIHNIKHMFGETIEEFMERFKIKTECMKGVPECMQIYGFMHGVNNLELTKRLNEHVPKTLEEMMTATMDFIRGETAAASKMKVHTPWKLQDQSKRHTSERRSDFRNQPKDRQRSNKFTPLAITPKEIFATESGKFKPPLPRLRKQIEELVRVGKLSHFIKEIRQDRDQQKTKKKDAPVKDKVIAIYMIRSWQRVTRQKLRPKIKNQMVPATTSLTDFSEETIWPLGQLRLLVTIGGVEHYTKSWMNFMIVRSSSPYNGIIERPGIREIQAVPSMAHGMLKFLVNGRILTIRSTILTPTECATIAATPKDSAKKIEAHNKKIKTVRHDGSTMIDCQASTRYPRRIFPCQTEKQGQAPERAKAIQVEVQKLIEVGIRREVYYHDWLSNPVMDFYPLPEIDWKVESLCGYPFKCFLDAYKGYHQMQMAEQDKEKTVFRTSHGVYCYTKMPFGLKNDGATYQRLVDKAFDIQIGWNLEICVDDLVIKSHTKTELLP
uniref:Reverse transcriptase domain-containing protein n=1 Tax=Tanacetum cinerariifolium TaxID=118510 RepID=A0A6L2LKZ6_TANCI|nr:reverse transcriptase domain-containing protein [Tanacetum cinerariifolium]